MIIDKDREDIYNFIYSLSDRYLKDFYRAAKKQLIARKLLNEEDLTIIRKKNEFAKLKVVHVPRHENENIIKENKGGPIVVYGKYSTKNKNLRFSLLDFLNEDWSFLFPEADNADKSYYVYFHTDPTQSNFYLNRNTISFCLYGKPFYFGKGKGDRYKSMHGRCTAHQKKVKDLVLHGVEKEKIFNILQDNLTEREAFELESKLITYFGTSGEYGTVRPYFSKFNGGILLNSDIARRPSWIDEFILHLSSLHHDRIKQSKQKRINKYSSESIDNGDIL